jgi:hypothetical protein
VTEENRWSITELLARYELEPDLSDVFVEGTLDRDVLSQSTTGQVGGRRFYEVDVVEVPAAVLAKYGLTSGNRQRVMALSRELERLPQEARVLCLVDRDLDHWFGDLPAAPRLRWSIYCSIENHFITRESISAILVVTARAKIEDLDSLADSLTSVLRLLYALRLADRQLGLSLRWVALRRYLAREGTSLSLDVTGYVGALLGSNGETRRRAEFIASYQRWLEALDCDIRLTVRGHDYTAILAWTVSKFGGQKEFGSEGAIERLFVLLARSIQTLSNELA